MRVLQDLLDQKETQVYRGSRVYKAPRDQLDKVDHLAPSDLKVQLVTKEHQAHLDH